MSRRARQRNIHPRRVATNAVQIAINGARALSDDDVRGQIALITRAVDEFTRGIDCARHWLSLADAANMAETFAAMGLGGGADAERVIDDAQRALAEVHRQHADRQSWTLWADQIEALRWLVQLHGTQLGACSYREFDTAFRRTAERVAQAAAGNAPRGTIVLKGAVCATTPGIDDLQQAAAT